MIFAYILCAFAALVALLYALLWASDSEDM